MADAFDSMKQNCFKVDRFQLLNTTTTSLEHKPLAWRVGYLNTSLDGLDHSLGAILHAHFPDDGTHMTFHSFRTDKK